MGRRSPESKREKRRRLRVKRRLRFTSSSDGDMCNSSDEIDQQAQVLAEGAEQDQGNDLGVELAAVEMTLEDELKDTDSDYSYEYLIECRKRLCARLEHSHCQLEKALSVNARQDFKHLKEIENITKFYQTIAYAKSRTGQLVRDTISTSSAAATRLEPIIPQNLPIIHLRISQKYPDNSQKFADNSQKYYWISGDIQS